MLLTIGAGGEGLTLTTASDVIIMGPDFNPTTKVQALSRAYRYGQTREVRVWELVALDSADIWIEGIANKKIAMGKDFLIPLEFADLAMWEIVKSWSIDTIKDKVCIYVIAA